MKSGVKALGGGRFEISGFAGGRRFHKVVRAKNLADARRLRENEMLETSIRSRGLVPASDPPFGELIEKFRAWAAEHHAASTIQHDRYTLDRFKDRWGHLPTSRINLDLVDLYIAARRAEGVKGRTINHDLAILGKVFSWASERGLARQRPWPLHRPRVGEVDSVRRQGFTEDESRRLLLAAKARLETAPKRPRAKEAWLWLNIELFAGLRPGREVFGLHWDDIDFQARTLTVRAENAKRGRGRVLPLHPVLAEVLERHAKPEGRIFSVKSFRDSWPALCKAAGVEYRAAYNLRHAFGSMLARSATVPELMAVMGHTNITTTQRYIHDEEERRRRAVEAMPDLRVAEVIPMEERRKG